MKARYFLFLGISLLALLLGWKLLSTRNINQMVEETPIENLMKEHGVLSRLLLIYDEIIFKMDSEEDLPPLVLKRTAGIIRNFLENYHEKLEEEHVFARFEKTKTMLDLVETLKDQHQKGRLLTDYILQHEGDSLKADSDEQEKLEDCMQSFIDMYRPHAAREDTVLFPAFSTLISETEYKTLGSIFENKEHELFGKEGFHNVLNDVAGIEKELGIYDLPQFSQGIDPGK